MYVGNYRSVPPWDVKSWVARKAVQFQGFAQHDSQEMLSVLLETMHEDVNQISKKPYVEQKDSNGRSDEVVATEFWNGFLQRERSIFVNIFYGQLKSRVQCSICRHVSITFDPFNVLSVPIPKQSQNLTKIIEYYPLSFVKPVLRIRLAVSSENATANELKQKVREAIY